MSKNKVALNTINQWYADSTYTADDVLMWTNNRTNNWLDLTYDERLAIYRRFNKR